MSFVFSLFLELLDWKELFRFNGHAEEGKSVESNSFEEHEDEENEQPTTTADDEEIAMSDDTGKSG